MFSGSDEDLHKIMDINKVFPKPPEVEEEMRRQKEEDLIRAEQEELARVKALAPVLVPPTMSQLMAAQIGLKKLKTKSYLAAISRPSSGLTSCNIIAVDKMAPELTSGLWGF